MTDDIVTLLRNKYQRQLPILLEAADEIERLQTKLLKYKEHAIHTWFCKEQVCEVCFDRFIEAKHGEVTDHE